jgi:hypothetical protein
MEAALCFVSRISCPETRGLKMVTARTVGEAKRELEKYPENTPLVGVNAVGERVLVAMFFDEDSDATEEEDRREPAVVIDLD